MPREKMLFVVFAESWREKVLPLWKPSSAASAKMHLKRYLIPEFGQTRLGYIKPENVQGLVSKLVAMGKSRSYVMNILATLASVLTSAAQWGHSVDRLDYRALVLPAQGERQKGRTFDPDQVRRILEASTEPDRTLYATAAMTGLRSGEIAGLQWDDVDIAGRVLTVRRSCFRGQMTSVKSRAGNRTVPIPDPLAAILADHSIRTGSAGLVFKNGHGGPLNMNDFACRHLAPMLKKLGIARAGWHAFRHAQASALVATGANPKIAQAQLGHSDIRVTLELYSHVIGDEHRKAVSRAAEMFVTSTEAKGQMTM